MTDKMWRSIENRLWVRLKVLEKQPELAATLSYATGVTCPRCGGILLHVPERAA